MGKYKNYLILKESAEPGQEIYFDENGNPQLTDPPLKKSRDVSVEVPFTHIGFSGKDTKEDLNPKVLYKPKIIKGKVYIKGTAFVTGKATGEVKSPPKNKEPDSFEKKLDSWGRILLSKKSREEYIGDLLEDRTVFEKRGLPKWKVNMISLGKLLLLCRASTLEWLKDLAASIFESFKELIS
jgi:hypothetical protein